MPQKNRPRLSWEIKSAWRRKDTGFYPDEVIQKIATQFDISGSENVHRLKERLETAGTMYLAWRHNTSGPKPKEVEAYFTQLVEHCDHLLRLIENVDEISWQHLWRAEERLKNDALYKGGTKMEEIGALRRANKNDPEGLIAEYTDLSDALVGIRYIKLLAMEAGDTVDSGKRGNKENRALYWWVFEMASYWEKELGRPFTVSYYGAIPSSDAGRFLEACLCPMDEASMEKLVYQMRKVLNSCDNRLPKRSN